MKNTILIWNKRMKKRRFLVLFYTGLFVMSGCAYGPVQNAPSEKALWYAENFEIIGSEKDDIIGKVNPAIFETSNRSNALAEEIDIPVVPKEGEKVKLTSGRYIITGYPTGNVFIRDEDGGLVLREIVGSYAGVGSLTVDIDESYTVRVDGGYDFVNILPVPTLLSTELTAGIWEVGMDIEAGKYSITTPNGLGYLQIFDKNDDPKMYELIGGRSSSTKSDVRLIAGQKLRVTGISLINFQPQEN